MKMKLGSLFDGSGGFPLAAVMCGIEPVWASEIEEYPIRVTKKNFPNMKHLGDITKINGAEVEPVDIITFGSPCQDLSIAGFRAGLEGERSGLFMEAIRIIKEMRDATENRFPRYAIWENVYGAFSSNEGRDFRVVLERFCRVTEEEFSVPECEAWAKAGEILADGYSIAWRTFDAQYWGVPQMRRRIFLVADFSGGGAGEILFKRDGLSRDFSEIRKTWESSATRTEGSARAAVAIKERHGKPGGGKGILIQDDKAGTIDCNNGQYIMLMQGSSPDKGAPRVYDGKAPTLKNSGDTVGSNLMVFYNNGTAVSYAGPMEKSPTLLNRMGTGGNNTPFVTETFRKVSRSKCKTDPTTWDGTEKSNCLNTFDMGEQRASELIVENEGL